MNIIIRKLDKNDKDMFIRYFEKDAFSDNPEWSGCYCMYNFFQGTNREWFQREKSQNKDMASKMIQDEAIRGFIVTDEKGKMIGWCNAGKKSVYKKDMFFDTIVEDIEKILSITCINIHYEYRKQGIATKIIKYIIENSDKEKYDYIEAYPYNDPVGDSQHYHGPKSMYEKLGFETYRKTSILEVMRKSTNDIDI